MFSNYEELQKYLLGYKSGQQVEHLLSSLSDYTDIEGFIVKDSDMDNNPATIDLIMVTTKVLVEATVVIDNKLAANNNFTLKTRKLKDILSKEVSLSNHGNLDNPVFKTLTYAFQFKDGYVLTLSNATKYTDKESLVQLAQYILHS
ncbi:hypothetical protein [Bacillus sp. T33-2]|uniref:hypothetical protein n=1 Tax=Bacillus sp. T33-2 TaxID=2054168 RepID=UPI000C75A0FE|nr:hypothetical protein [Bacillus sp. T33-2]PLR93202.1 hypothetical protein CVD19_19555 [Bacillus sp. T33-2]